MLCIWLAYPLRIVIFVNNGYDCLANSLLVNTKLHRPNHRLAQSCSKLPHPRKVAILFFYHLLSYRSTKQIAFAGNCRGCGFIRRLEKFRWFSDVEWIVICYRATGVASPRAFAVILFARFPAVAILSELFGALPGFRVSIISRHCCSSGGKSRNILIPFNFIMRKLESQIRICKRAPKQCSGLIIFRPKSTTPQPLPSKRSKRFIDLSKQQSARCWSMDAGCLSTPGHCSQWI